jgi:P pilus assembly chaperone PapD
MPALSPAYRSLSAATGTIAYNLATVAVAVLTLGLSPLTPVSAQVVISPPVITLVEPERFGTFTLENRSVVPQEVTVEFRFGYPVSDSAGNLSMAYDDSAAAARSSIVPWVRAFPRRVLLAAGERQLVRLTVRPPEGLAAGVYWARLVITSVPESPPVDTAQSGITTQITFRLQQITTVLYRRGEARTALEAGDIAVRGDSAVLQLLVPLKRTGIAPFLGSVRLRVEDAHGALVHEATETASVYYSLVKRLAVPRSHLPAGTYTAEITVVAERPDIAADALFAMTPLHIRTRFTVP